MALRIYTVDEQYIRELHLVDNKVSFEHPNAKSRKFVCIEITIDHKRYCIPFSSPDNKDYIFKNGRYVPRRSFYPAIYRMFKVENNNRHFLGKLLFNNMIPVSSALIDEYDLENETDLAYKNLVRSQYNIIRRLYRNGTLHHYTEKIYQEKIEGKDVGYIAATVDFEKLERQCRISTSHRLQIHLKSQYKKKEYIEISNMNEILDCIKISEHGYFSKIEDLDFNNFDLQKIKVYAKDEFGQEKYIEIIIKITSKTLSKTT